MHRSRLLLIASLLLLMAVPRAMAKPPIPIVMEVREKDGKIRREEAEIRFHQNAAEIISPNRTVEIRPEVAENLRDLMNHPQEVYEGHLDYKSDTVRWGRPKRLVVGDTITLEADSKHYVQIPSSTGKPGIALRDQTISFRIYDPKNTGNVGVHPANQKLSPIGNVPKLWVIDHPTDPSQTFYVPIRTTTKPNNLNMMAREDDLALVKQGKTKDVPLFRYDPMAMEYAHTELKFTDPKSIEFPSIHVSRRALPMPPDERKTPPTEILKARELKIVKIDGASVGYSSLIMDYLHYKEVNPKGDQYSWEREVMTRYSPSNLTEPSEVRPGDEHIDRFAIRLPIGRTHPELIRRADGDFLLRYTSDDLPEPRDLLLPPSVQKEIEFLLAHEEHTLFLNTGRSIDYMVDLLTMDFDPTTGKIKGVLLDFSSLSAFPLPETSSNQEQKSTKNIRHGFQLRALRDVMPYLEIRPPEMHPVPVTVSRGGKKLQGVLIPSMKRPDVAVLSYSFKQPVPGFESILLEGPQAEKLLRTARYENTDVRLNVDRPGEVIARLDDKKITIAATSIDSGDRENQALISAAAVEKLRWGTRVPSKLPPTSEGYATPCPRNHKAILEIIEHFN